MNITVRPATESDRPFLLQLVEQYWQFERLEGFDAAGVGDALARFMDDRSLGNAWLASDGEHPVGYLIAVYVFSLEHLGLTAEIDEFFVVPATRGRGAGSRLLQAAEAEFARRKCTNVSLQLGRENRAARNFYLAQGYGARDGFELLDKRLPRG